MGTSLRPASWNSASDAGARDIAAGRPLEQGLDLSLALTPTSNEEHLAALRAYEIQPLLWSHRQQAVSILDGRE
jgi:hypothetical protein